mmetsp:Transcript_84316/g.140595  ORF Transcript_84316/g.140595 Transcript_84316/m.140595 type:complete len:222 (+) Transcript_84316:840-1505(+)
MSLASVASPLRHTQHFASASPSGWQRLSSACSPASSPSRRRMSALAFAMRWLALAISSTGFRRALLALRQPSAWYVSKKCCSRRRVLRYRRSLLRYRFHTAWVRSLAGGRGLPPVEDFVAVGELFSGTSSASAASSASASASEALSPGNSRAWSSVCTSVSLSASPFTTASPSRSSLLDSDLTSGKMSPHFCAGNWCFVPKWALIWSKHFCMHWHCRHTQR